MGLVLMSHSTHDNTAVGAGAARRRNVVVMRPGSGVSKEAKTEMPLLKIQYSSLVLFLLI